MHLLTRVPVNTFCVTISRTLVYGDVDCMEEANNSKRQKNEGEGNQKKHKSAFTWLVICAWLMLIGTALAILFAQNYVTEQSPKIQFVSQFLFSFATVVII